MKNIIAIVTLFVLSFVVGSTANAADTNQTVQVSQVPNLMPTLTNAPAAPDVTKFDLTISGSGLTIPKTGENTTALSVSLSCDPISSLRNLWFGVAQSVSWETFAGSTDFDADYLLWSGFKDKLYIYGGANIGATYDSSSAIGRAGPELIAQYYFSDDVYLIGQYDYDFVTKGNSDGRWSLGIGFEF